MTKQNKPLISVSKTDLAKMSRSEQRRHLELGYVQGADPEPAPEGATAKK